MTAFGLPNFCTLLEQQTLICPIKTLGLEPSLLDAVRKEGTAVLPGLFEDGQADN